MVGRLILALATMLLFILPIAGLQAQRLLLAFRLPDCLVLRTEQPRLFWALVAGNIAWLILFLGAGVSIYWSPFSVIAVIALATLLFAGLDFGSFRRLATQGAWIGLDGQIRRREDRPRSYRSWLTIKVGIIAVQLVAAVYLLWQFFSPH